LVDAKWLAVAAAAAATDTDVEAIDAAVLLRGYAAASAALASRVPRP